VRFVKVNRQRQSGLEFLNHNRSTEMKRRSAAWGGVILLLLSTAAIAGGWGQNTTIAGYFVWDNGLAYIRTPAHQNPDNCQSSLYLSVDPTALRFKEIWATIIAAQAAGSTVTLSYNGCDGSYPRINAVAVPQIW
jgi:hypothetical protein